MVHDAIETGSKVGLFHGQPDPWLGVHGGLRFSVVVNNNADGAAVEPAQFHVDQIRAISLKTLKTMLIKPDP